MGNSRVKITGHAGAGLLAPPNTIEGFAAGIAAGVHRVEFDVLAHKGQLLLAHDTGKITADTLTLEEGLQYLAGMPVALSCDVKSFGSESLIGGALAAFGVACRTVVCGHDRATLDGVVSYAPGAVRGWSVPEPAEAVRTQTVPSSGLRRPRARRRLQQRLPAIASKAVSTGSCDCLMVNYKLVSADLVDALHAAGGFIHVWTVDDPSIAVWLAELQVDEIITNDPPTIFSALRQPERR